MAPFLHSEARKRTQLPPSHAPGIEPGEYFQVKPVLIYRLAMAVAVAGALPPASKITRFCLHPFDKFEGTGRGHSLNLGDSG